MRTDRHISCLALAALLLVTGCAYTGSFRSEYATGHYSSDIEQCAIHARKVSDVELYGDAYTWWDQARGQYRRGHVPAKGAILVLKQTSKMRSGHVAVVRNIVSSREINVTHTNWGSDRKSRHIVYDSMRVEDVSPRNDWSQVKFWNEEKGVMGFPYAAYGFIYP